MRAHLNSIAIGYFDVLKKYYIILSKELFQMSFFITISGVLFRFSDVCGFYWGRL